MGNIFGVIVNSGLKSDLLREIVEMAEKKAGSCLIYTPNPAFILYAQKDINFKDMLNRANINLPDGVGFVIFSRLMGWGIRERIAGSDIVRELLDVGNKNRWLVGLVGMRNGVVSEVSEQIRRLGLQYPNIIFVDLNKQKVNKDKQYQLILACQGMIHQENWIWGNKDKYKVGVMMGVGGSLDFLTGFTKRAPVWVQNCGFEWFWRIIQKPSHYRRALKSVFGFSWLVVKTKILRS